MVRARQTLSGRTAEEKGRASCGGKDLVCLAVPDCRYGREKWGVQREASGAGDGTLGTVPRCVGAGHILGPERPYSIKGQRMQLVMRAGTEGCDWAGLAGLGEHCLALSWRILQVGQISWAEELSPEVKRHYPRSSLLTRPQTPSPH